MSHAQSTSTNRFYLDEEVTTNMHPSCLALSEPVTRQSVSSTGALERATGNLMECLGVAAGSYYDAVPLLFIRLLQLQLYGVVYNRSAGYLAEGRLKLAVLTDSIEPHGARSPLQQRSIGAALQGYQLCGRSGFYDVASRGAQPAWTPKASDPNRSLHMHLHLTHHGGTTMGIMALRGTCQLLGGKMGHAAIIEVHGGDPSQIQRELLSLETNASVRFDACRNFGFACRTADSRCLDCQRFHNASMDGRAPPLTTSRLVDFGQFEPRLPLNAPVPSDRIVWSTNVPDANEKLLPDPQSCFPCSLDAHTFLSNLLEKEGCCTESDTLEASRSVTLTCGAT